MVVRPAEGLHHVLAVHVVGAGHEAGLGPDGHADRVERLVDRAERRGLGDLADLARGRVLALGQPVDLVVEQQDGEVHVAAQRVDQVVATDRQHVAVTTHHPHVEVGAGDGQPGGHRRCPAVDAVHAVGVHVVREAGRAADAGHEDGVLAADAQVGHQHLHGGEDRVVAATGAPTDLLVARPVLLGGDGDRGQSSRASRISISSSPAVKGTPLTLLTDGRRPGTRPAAGG